MYPEDPDSYESRGSTLGKIAKVVFVLAVVVEILFLNARLYGQNLIIHELDHSLFVLQNRQTAYETRLELLNKQFEQLRQKYD